MKTRQSLIAICAGVMLGLAACRKSEPTRPVAPVSPTPMDRFQSEVRLDAPVKEPDPEAKRRWLQRLESDGGKN